VLLRSPDGLSADVAAGHLGLTIATAGLGTISAIVIPKFLDYQTKSKVSEAELNLRAIDKALTASYAENARFPVGSVPLTPSTPCCAGPGHRCPANPSDWQGVPVWDELAFEQTRPSFFQYAYQSDGTTFTARAVGDLDCDGVTVEYVLEGNAAGGQPTSTLRKPTRAD
jgi:type II secretory pathway pseudopilin PulG